MNRRELIRAAVIVCGLAGVGISLFAFQLGLDNDPGWGPARMQILAAGVALLAFGAAYWIMPHLSESRAELAGRLNGITAIQGVQRRIGRIGFRIGEMNRKLAELPFLLRLLKSRTISWIWQHRTAVGLALLGVFVAWLYVWVITIGRMEKWPSGRDYYWLLIQAFRQGQAHLLVQPGPDLLNLENPYDHHQRKGLEYLWDATLYDGKYFLYWGPTPAVLGTIVSWLTGRPVTDAGLVFAFTAGTALFSVLLLYAMRREFRMAGWIFWGGALASAMNIPLIWLLTRPTFYEVSISGGQFFLMAGLFLCFTAFRDPMPRPASLFFSALAFGLAGATRINLLPSVSLLALGMLWRILAVHRGNLRAGRPAIASVLAPLLLIAACLMWYNHARFGSVFEFGHRFQLTGPSLPANYEDVSSIAYVVPNAYNYFLRPPNIGDEFPYLTLSWIKQDMWPRLIRLPQNYYYTEPVAGILFVLPLAGFAALLAFRHLWLWLNGEALLPRGGMGDTSGLFTWFGLLLSAYLVVQGSILLVFINSAVRYLFDLSPVLIVAIVMYGFRYAQSPSLNLLQTRLLVFLWILAALLTAAMGIVIGLTGEGNNFLNHNPGAFYRLLEWFGG
jgi:hypothetical protein